MIHFIFLVYLHYIHLKFHQLFGDGLCLLDHVVVLGKAKPLDFKLEFNRVSRAEGHGRCAPSVWPYALKK